MPVLVFFLFQCLDPVVGDTHSHAVVEAYAAVFDRQRETRHTAHLLRDSDRMTVVIMDKLVGQCQISYGVRVLSAVVVVTIPPERLT